MTDFQITDIYFSNSFEKDIKEKVTSEQEAVKVMNNHDQGKGKIKRNSSRGGNKVNGDKSTPLFNTYFIFFILITIKS